MITNVRRGTRTSDARFPWVLTVSGIPAECDSLRWEQFVAGGFRIYFADGTSRWYSAVETMRRINPNARRFGRWSDDLLRDMTPGPRAIGGYPAASCGGGVLRPLDNPRGTMRGPSAQPVGASYRFEDAPGFSRDFGDTISGGLFVGVGWSTAFEHKLWRPGEQQPMHRVVFRLTGRYDRRGADTRAIRMG